MSSVLGAVLDLVGFVIYLGLSDVYLEGPDMKLYFKVA